MGLNQRPIMSPIMEMTNVTFEEISKERISESFGNNDLIGTLVFLVVSIVLFFTMPYKMLARQKKNLQHIFKKEEALISSVARRETGEQTLAASSNNARPVQTTSV